jgi:hypothetical protein
MFSRYQENICGYVILGITPYLNQFPPFSPNGENGYPQADHY